MFSVMKSVDLVNVPVLFLQPGIFKHTFLTYFISLKFKLYLLIGLSINYTLATAENGHLYLPQNWSRAKI